MPSALSLLPIGRTSSDASAAASLSRRSSSLVSGMTPSAASRSSDDDLKLAVKNTFIDVEAFEYDEREELPLHQLGAQTCTARLSQIGRCFPDADEKLETSTQDEETQAEDSDLEETDVSHSNTMNMVEATPDAACSSRPMPPDVMNMPPVETRRPELQTIACPMPARGRQAAEASSPQRQVMLQVPLEVASSSQEDAQVAVLGSTAKSLGGCTVVDLRVVVGPTGELQVFQTPAGQVLLSACLGSHATASTDGASSRGAGSVPPSPVPAAAAADVPVPPPPRLSRSRTQPTEKSSMVCCHWKNKGWCRYQDSCKFMHPEHKRGVGCSAAKGAAPAAATGLPGSSPGVPPAGGRRLPQPVGGVAAGASHRLSPPEPLRAPTLAPAQALGGLSADLWRHAAATLAAQLSAGWPAGAYGQHF